MGKVRYHHTGYHVGIEVSQAYEPVETATMINLSSRPWQDDPTPYLTGSSEMGRGHQDTPTDQTYHLRTREPRGTEENLDLSMTAGDYYYTLRYRFRWEVANSCRVFTVRSRLRYGSRSSKHSHRPNMPFEDRRTRANISVLSLVSDNFSLFL